MIRAFESQDINQLVELAEKHCNEADANGYGEFNVNKIVELVKTFHNQPNRELLMAWRGGEIVGYVLVGIYRKQWSTEILGDIAFLYVAPEYRNGFIAKDLYQNAYDWFRQRDVKTMTANVQAWNKDYEICSDFVEQGEKFFGAMMNPVGTCFVKEIV